MSDELRKSKFKKSLADPPPSSGQASSHPPSSHPNGSPDTPKRYTVPDSTDKSKSVSARPSTKQVPSTWSSRSFARSTRDGGFTSDTGEASEFESGFSEIMEPRRGSPPSSPKTSMYNFRYHEYGGEGEYMGEHGYAEVGTEPSSSFQFSFRRSLLLSKSVDSEEYALRHGAHIGGTKQESDAELVEPMKTESEIWEELMKDNERRTLLERESVARETLLVWEVISRYVIRKLTDSIGVRVPGLGTFTQATLPNDLLMQRHESEKYLLRRLRRFPMFKICPHVREMSGLVEENYLYQCNTPVICLSTAAIAQESKLPRGLVQGIITETLVAFSRGVCTFKDVEFPFPYIGKMYVKNRKVYMFFYRQFCEGLQFDFNLQMNMIQSVFLGSMTPLFYHRPTLEVNSVFHYNELKSVGPRLRTNPAPYVSGDLVRDDAEDRCKFMQKLFTHSNIPFDCSCCKCKPPPPPPSQGGEDDEEAEETETFADYLCEFSKNYDRIERSCCTQPGRFSFQQPDGSTFSPEPLYKTAKTGNPVLDRLTDDRCLLHQALSCWIKRDFLQNLGSDEIARHYDRAYFKRKVKPRRKTFVEAPESTVDHVSTADSTDTQEEIQPRKSRDSDFYKRLEQCLIALEEAKKEEAEEEEESASFETIVSEEGEISEEADEEQKKPRRYHDFEVFSGFYYNLLENDRAMRNESDYHLLSRTPSTSSAGASPTRTKSLSSGSSESTPSSPLCWEQAQTTSATVAPEPTPALPPPAPGTYSRLSLTGMNTSTNPIPTATSNTAPQPHTSGPQP